MVFVRLEFISKDIQVLESDPVTKTKFYKDINIKGFRLLRNLKYTDIYCNSEECYSMWLYALKKLTIQTNFHDSFTVNEKIGRGSFAKVYLVTETSSGTFYACKAFNKGYLLSQRKGKDSRKN